MLTLDGRIRVKDIQERSTSMKTGIVTWTVRTLVSDDKQAQRVRELLEAKGWKVQPQPNQTKMKKYLVQREGLTDYRAVYDALSSFEDFCMDAVTTPEKQSTKDQAP
jgi:hypothetical protein